VTSPTLSLLEIAEGPLFRFAFALLVLGLLRGALLAGWNTVGAWLTAQDAAVFRQKLRLRILWVIFPITVLRRAWPGRPRGVLVYYFIMSGIGLAFRTGIVAVPAFMAAHVYLWERGLGLTWPALPGHVADRLAQLTIAAGLIWFLGRLYAPPLRRIEPGWTFLKPLILLLPLVTGVLAVHPTWSPVDYHVIRLLHVVSAAAVFVLIPFARMLAGMHAPLTRWLPEAAWDAPGPAPGGPPAEPRPRPAAALAGGRTR
jgi:hypothetical protein